SVSIVLSGPMSERHHPVSPHIFELPVKAWFTKTIGAVFKAHPNN